MFDAVIQKIIARYGEREVVDSSAEEMQQFIVEGIRPDFDDRDVLCVSFLISEDTEEFESSPWFINPIVVEGSPIFNYIADGDSQFYFPEHVAFQQTDDESMEFFSIFGYSYKESYGPTMASEFLPELLILQQQYPYKNIFQTYEIWLKDSIKYIACDIPDATLLQVFIKSGTL